MRKQIYMFYLTCLFVSLALPNISVLFGIFPYPACWAICIWWAVLLVMAPLGQVDISPFSKNLSQAAYATTCPSTKAFEPFLANPLSSLWLFVFFTSSGFSFSYHQLGFFAIPALKHWQ